MLNYTVEPELLGPFVPFGTELDFFEGQAFVSLVGFRFLNTRVLGLRVPFHHDFDEVNLRFYVRRKVDGEVRRGVVFIREIVPRRAIAYLARAVYNENYVRLPMSHRTEQGVSADYQWRFLGKWNRLYVEASGEGVPCQMGSCEEFITEHYWGYAKQRDGGSVEYEVQHPAWQVWRARAAGFEGEIAGLYGAEFSRVLSRPPNSALLADGSAVVVYRPTRLKSG